MHQLTKPQKLIYDMEKFAGGSIATVCGSIVIEGKKEISEITNAVNEVYRINDALRTRITETDGVPYQYVTEYQEQNIEVLRFENKAELDSYAQKFAREPLDFYGSLCDIKAITLDDSYGLLMKLHHIISDAWTLTLLGSQFAQIMDGKTPEVYSYLDYIAEEEKYLISKRYAKDRDYYIEQFKKCDEVTYISDKQVTSYEAARKTFVIDADKTTQLIQYSEKHNTSLFMLLMTALGVYINRIKMNEEKFYIGTAVLNRSGLKEQNTAGMFINTVPFLFELQNENTFANNLENAANASMSIFRHQRFNYGDILKTLRSEFNFSGNLYDVMLSYQNAKITGAKDTFETTWYSCGMQTESLQIHIDDRDSEGILKIHYDYQTEKFTENEIEKMHEHLFNLLFDAIKNDNKKIYELEILSQAERNILLYEFNNTKIDYPKDKCVHQLFEEQVLKTPDKTAVIACDKTLTYSEVNIEANKIAHALINKGVDIGDIVAVILPRNSHLIPALFGVLKAGAAYMPIDPDYPKERKEYLLNESNAKFCIDNSNIYKLTLNDNSDNLQIPVDSDNLFCALHTSGSTGKPKLALLKQYNVLNFLYSNLEFFDNVDTVISVTIITFDVFMQDSLLPLSLGKEVMLASNEQIYNQIEFEKMFDSADNVMFFSTPTKLEHYIVSSKTGNFLTKIRTLIVGGEVFSEQLYNLILKKIKSNNVYNGYGPVETTIGVSYANVTPPPKNLQHIRTNGNDSLCNKISNLIIYNIYGPTETYVASVDYEEIFI